MASSQGDLPPAIHMQCFGHPIGDSEGKVSQPEHHEDLVLVGTGRDDIRLQRLGKNPVLKRNWGVLSILGLACTILGTWEGLLATFILSLTNGGSAGAVYGFIFVWAGTACYFIVLAELASMAPTSGGQYHWCAMLAPRQCRNLLSYITGWLSVVGWQAAFASSCFLVGVQAQGVASLAHDDYHAKAYQGTLIMWAFICIVLTTNVVGGKFLPRLESGLLCFHIVGFFGITIPLVAKSHHRSKEQVFEEFLNGGKFFSQGLSWFVGLSGAAFAFGGGDASVHMAEECANAESVIPKAMMFTVAINGSLGFGMLLSMLFCSNDIPGALASRSGFPFMEIFLQGTHSMGGALTMISVLIFAAGCSVFGMLAATSRQFWSFSRDKGVPFWKFWSKVDGRHLPVPSILLTVIIAALLGLINIGSKLALEDILSMAVSGLYSSYLIINMPGEQLAWGPFHIPGALGVLVNTLSVIYMMIVIFFSFWPSEMHPKAKSMNYSVVGTGGIVALAVVYYAIRARHVYQGPIIEVRERGCD